MTYEEAEDLVTRFEQGSYPAASFSHYAHVVMALWYTYHQPLAQARASIKDGLRRYLVAIGVPQTEDAGYHETVTELFFQLIVQYQLRFPERDFAALLAGLERQPFLEKHFTRRYYDDARLMSREARASFLAPERAPLLGCEFRP